MSLASPMFFIGHDPSTASCPDTAFTSALAKAKTGLAHPSSILLLSCKRVTPGARLRTIGGDQEENPLL